MKLLTTKCHEWPTLWKLWRQTGDSLLLPMKCWPLLHVIRGGLMLLLESQCIFQFFFVLCCYITNHLMTGPKWNSKFCFPRISMFPSTLSWETLIFSGNKIHCSLRDQSLTVKYYFVCRPYLICSEKWTTNFEEQMMPVNKYLKHIFTPNGGYCVCYPWTIFLQEAQWLCSSRKYPCLPQGRLTGIPKGQGVSESQFFERKYDTKMEFLEGWGVQFKKKLPWEGYGYFLEQHNVHCSCLYKLSFFSAKYWDGLCGKNNVSWRQNGKPAL